MKKFILLLLVFAVVAACQKTDPIAEMEGEASLKSAFIDPADAPNGKHFNLNIIGVPNPKTADMDSEKGVGGVIFVDLYGKNKINLVKGDDYAVLDKNGTDSDGALLQLPDPGLDPYVVDSVYPKGFEPDVMSDYSVYVRPLGRPGGWSTITTCADVDSTNLSAFMGNKDVKALNAAADLGGIASVEQVGVDITFREQGKSLFTNVTAELLTIVLKVSYDSDGDGTMESVVYVRVPIFDDIIENEYWEYDNKGLKLLQVRFYQVETDVSLGDSELPAL